MRRRALLAAVGTGTVATTAGCTGVLGGDSCGPGEDEIGAVGARAAEGDLPSSVSITGAVAQFVEPPEVTVTGKLMVLADGTGRAVAYPPRALEFNPEVIDRGACLTLDAPLNESRTRTLELPVVMVQTSGDLEEDGSGDAPEELPTRPDADFEFEWTQAASYEGKAVTLHHRNGAAVPADELLVEFQGERGGAPARWHELADGVGPDDEVTPGDSVHVDAERGALVWDHSDEWRRPLELWPVGRWAVDF